MSIKKNEIRFMDKDTIAQIIGNTDGKEVRIQIKPRYSDEIISEETIPRKLFLSYSTFIEERVVNMKPGFAGLRNCGYSCYMNSIFQSIINCSPLRHKIMIIKAKPENYRRIKDDCKSEVIEDFFRVIHMLLSEKGTLDITFFIQSIRPYFSRIDDPTVFLDFIYSNLVSCGYLSKRNKENQFEGLKLDISKKRVRSNNTLMAAIEVGSKSCLPIPAISGQSLQVAIDDYIDIIILSDEQDFIILHPDNSTAEGVATRLPHHGIININQHRFRVCSVIVRVGIGHYYTVTRNGRYDDDNVEESTHFMENLLRDGYDIQTVPEVRRNNGCYYFFEKIKDEDITDLRPRAMGHFSMRDEDITDTSRGATDLSGMRQHDEDDNIQLFFLEIYKKIENFKKLLSELSKLKDKNAIDKKKEKLAVILKTVLDLKTKIDYKYEKYKELFGIAIQSPKLIELHQIITDLIENEDQIKREMQRRGIGGNPYYKNKYLIYKKKYLLLKKNMNN
jgi:hypothetical protein